MTTASTSNSTSEIQEGDFFTSSWGYDQTNVGFYMVVEVLPASVRVIRVMADVVADHGHTVELVPDSRPSDGAQVQTKRLTADGSIKCGYAEYARPWSGRPMHATGFGRGH